MATRKRIPLSELKIDTFYDSPLWLDDTYLILTQDTPVTRALVQDLESWGFKGVWTDGSPIGSGAPAGTAGDNISGAVLNNDAKEKEGRRKARTFFESLATFARRVYETFDRDGHLDMTSITEQVKETIAIIKERRAYILRLPDLKSDGIDYLYTHSARSTILALTLGEAMKLPPFKLIELGISALLHEVGMVKIPRQVYDKAAALTDAEKKLVDTHPAQGLKMLQDYSKENALPLPQDILMGVWQHHERANGSGYPQRLKGDEITMFGKIIGAACSYDAQVSRRPFRDQKDGYSSLILMLREMQDLYDEKVIRALLLSLSIYPLGSYVRLENGGIGVVVDTNKDNPKFPVVKLLLDEDLHLYKEQPVLKTKEEDGLAIVGVLSSDETKELQDKDILPR